MTKETVLSKDLLESKEQGQRLIKAAHLADKKASEAIHQAGVFSVFHAAQHGDTSLMNELYNGLSPAHALSFTKFVLNVNQVFGEVFAKNKKEGFHIVKGDKREPSKQYRSDIVEKGKDFLFTIPWFTEKDKEKAENQFFNVLNGASNLLKKIEKEAETRELKPEENVIFKALLNAQEQVANLNKVAA